MPDLADALDQLRAADPALGLAPLSTTEREANRNQIIAAGPAKLTVRRSLRHALRHRQAQERWRLSRSQRTARFFHVRRWVVLCASATAVLVAALVGVENGDGGAHIGLSFTVPPAAAAQLKRVAHAAAVQVMPAAGQWEYLAIKLESTGTISYGNPTGLQGTRPTGYPTLTYRDTQTEQTWYATDGAARQRISNDSFKFATPKDQAIYLANKSVLKNQLSYNPLVTGVFEDKMFPSKGASQPVWVTSPPSGPRTLIKDIWDQYVSATGGPHQPGLNAGRPEVLVTSLTQLLLASTSAKLRATAYRALAYVPYTTVLGAQTDQLGRSGIAISFTHDGTGTNQTLIVSPVTGDLLELDQTQKKTANGIQTGTVTQREMFLKRAIVGSAVALPTAATSPSTPPRRANRDLH
jgi:hypothetical protein